MNNEHNNELLELQDTTHAVKILLPVALNFLNKVHYLLRDVTFVCTQGFKNEACAKRRGNLDEFQCYCDDNNLRNGPNKKVPGDSDKNLPEG